MAASPAAQRPVVRTLLSRTAPILRPWTLRHARGRPRALKAASVPVRYRCYDGLCHAFTAFTGAVPAADAACREIAALVRDLLWDREDT